MKPWLEQRYFGVEGGHPEVEAGIDRMADDLSLDYWRYGLIRGPRHGPVHRCPPAEAEVFGRFPAEFVELYIARGYVLLDPVCDRSLRSNRPFFWDHGRFLRGFRAPQRRVFQEARRFGIESGLAIPVHSADGAVGVFTVASGGWNRLWKAVRGEHSRLMAVAFDVHEATLHRKLAEARACGSCRGPDPAGVGPLSVRERECLSWTLEGLTAEQIGDRLNISQFTVNRHASNAVRKLGCSNKHHAAIRALRMGWI